MIKFQSKYRRIKEIGKGAYGKVFLAKDTTNGTQCVVKAIDASKMHPKEEEMCLNEIKIMQKLNHPFVIGIRDSLVVKKSIVIVMDLAEGGDLETRIKAQKGKLFENDLLKKWIVQLITGVENIHANKIMHRDIKCQNIFLKGNSNACFGDFGLGKMSDVGETIVGTPVYLSPEIINECKYDCKTDIWSLGVLLYEICALKLPFTSKVPSADAVKLKIVQGTFPPLPKEIPEDICKLIGNMLTLDPTQRPSAKQLLGYNYMTTWVDIYITNAKDESKELIKMNSNASTGSNLSSLNSLKKDVKKNTEPPKTSGFKVGRGLNHQPDTKLSVTKTNGNGSMANPGKAPSKSPARDGKAKYDNYGNNTTKAPAKDNKGFTDAIERNKQSVSGYRGQIKQGNILATEAHKTPSNLKPEPVSKKRGADDWADDINDICNNFDNQYMEKYNDSSDEDEEEYERQLRALEKSLGPGETLITKAMLSFDPLEQQTRDFDLGGLASIVSVNHDTVSTAAMNMQKNKQQKALYDQIKKEMATGNMDDVVEKNMMTQDKGKRDMVNLVLQEKILEESNKQKITHSHLIKKGHA